MPDAADPLKPRSPLPRAPAGYMRLEGHSSLKRYWDLLRGLAARGYGVEVPRRSPPDACRRAIVGVRLGRAGGLLDAAALREALEDEDAGLDLAAFTLPDGAREAVNALLAGDADPLRRLLSERYTLDLELVLGFTVTRDLVLKADARYWPTDEREAPFPLDWPLRAVRWRRDDYRALLESRAGLTTR